MIYKIFIVIILMTVTVVCSKSAILDEYIRQGLENNLALKQQNFSFQKSKAALRQAQGLFFPSISINARYSRAGGGREISFPVGDLLNPVYTALNDLFAAQGQPSRPYPVLENEIIPFLREEEHDTKIRAVQPIFQPAIFYNYKLKSRLRDVEQAKRDVFARDLVLEIKKAYFNHLKADALLEVFKKTELLLIENLRVSEKLYENQKTTIESVYRAKAELSELEQKKMKTESDIELSQAYFNFLLNRPLDQEVKKLNIDDFLYGKSVTLAEAEVLAVQNREELTQIQLAEQAALQSANLAKSSFMPSISAVLDYGYQGEEYRFTSQDDYWMASAVLRWNIFNGFQDKAKVEQANIDRKRYKSQLDEFNNQISLQVRQAYYNLQVAQKAIMTSEVRAKSAGKSFKIIKKKYGEGIVPQIEFLSARASLTQAEINKVIAAYDYHNRFAEFDRVTARYPLKNKIEE